VNSKEEESSLSVEEKVDDEKKEDLFASKSLTFIKSEV